MIQRGCWLMLGVVLLSPIAVAAAPPWGSFLPFRRVEADARKEYKLTEEHGPWLIMAASFAGEGAHRQAHDLVIELRKKHALNAYVSSQKYDFTNPVDAIGFERDGTPKKLVHRKREAFEEYAVLVGDFESVYDPQAKKALEVIKFARPNALDVVKRGMTTQRLAGLRDSRSRRGEEGRSKGPMRAAFMTRNPMLPAEFFAPKGLDPLVASMNENVEYSLLNNPGRYSVKVGTYRGRVSLNVNEIKQLRDQPLEGGDSKLAQAAEKAHDLTVALRKAGVEAYEFHDRHESIVTVGSFDSIGEERADGKIEINPAVHRIIKSYSASQKVLAGYDDNGLMPHSYAGVAFDVQPVPVETPRVSIAAQYAPRGSIFDR